MTAPGYWMYETSGVLRPAVEAYLSGLPMSAEHLGAMKAYVRQWIEKGAFQGVDDLKARVDGIKDRKTLSKWLFDAIDAGIDPL